MKLLIVEDSTTYAEYVTHILCERDPGIICAVETKLSSALVALRREAFDAVLLDLTLPDSPRWQTMKTIGAIASVRPVVVMTGWDDESVAVEAIREGAQDFLPKSQVTRDRLLECITSAIERHLRAVEARRLFEAAGVPSPPTEQRGQNGDTH